MDPGFWIAAVVGCLAIYYYRQTRTWGYLFAGAGLLGLTLQDFYPASYTFMLMVLFSITTVYGLSGIVMDYINRHNTESQNRDEAQKKAAKKSGKGGN